MRAEEAAAAGPTTIERVAHDTDWLTVTFDDGTVGRYLGTWLRDNTGKGRHQSQGQRTFDINLMDKVSIVDARVSAGDVEVQFGDDGGDLGRAAHSVSPAGSDPGVSTHRFDGAWLQEFSTPEPPTQRQTLWASEQQDCLSFVDYASASNDPAALQEFLGAIDHYGFALLDNVPCVPGTILDVVALFGYIRDTNYGPIFDVRIEPDPANLAFTSASIGMHTDNPYRDPVPGLQLLHCLVNDSDGGESQLVDGFAVAQQLRTDHPEAFEILTTIPVEFRFVEVGSADLRHRTPLISMQGETITEIRYNCRSIQAFDLPADEIAAFYEAYRILGAALHDPAARIEFRLEPGQLMVFDNQRVLHGRSSYEEGARHLQGCYADKDSLTSKLRTLKGAL